MKIPNPDLDYAIDEGNNLVNGYRIQQAIKYGLDSEIDSSYNQNHIAMIKFFAKDSSELPKSMEYIVPGKVGVFRRYNRKGRFATESVKVDEITIGGVTKDIYEEVPAKSRNFLTTYSYFTNPHNLSKDNNFPTFLALSCHRQFKHVCTGILRIFFHNLSVMTIALKLLALVGILYVSKSFEIYDIISYLFFAQLLLLGEAQNKTDTRGRWKTILGKKVSENEAYKYISIGDLITFNHCSVLLRAAIFSMDNSLFRFLGYVILYPFILFFDLFNLLDMAIKVHLASKEKDKVHNASEFGTLCRQYFMSKVCPTFLSNLTLKQYAKIRLGVSERCRLYFVDNFPEDESGRVYGTQEYVNYLCEELGL